MDKFHEVRDVIVDGNQIRIHIDGNDYSFEPKDVSKRLMDASALERDTIEVSPSGYGIHWPLIDEDISIDGLLGVVHHPSQSRMSA